MKKIILMGMVIFLLSLFQKNSSGYSEVLATNLTSGTQTVGSYLQFNYYCSVGTDSADGVYKVYIPWNLDF
ncbi:MAG: hypothetical protein AAB732_00605, partial [Patescibacteria group bacterium]